MSHLEARETDQNRRRNVRQVRSISFSIDEDVITRVNNQVLDGAFPNRSAFVESAIRKLLSEVEENAVAAS